jgi:hypothetical protein
MSFGIFGGGECRMLIWKPWQKFSQLDHAYGYSAVAKTLLALTRTNIIEEARRTGCSLDDIPGGNAIAG